MLDELRSRSRTAQERLGGESALEGHQAGISSVGIARDGGLIVSGGEDIRIWEPKGKLARRIASAGTAVALSPDGKTILFTRMDSSADDLMLELPVRCA